jgi:PKD domain/Bacterial Ig domain
MRHLKSFFLSMALLGLSGCGGGGSNCALGGALLGCDTKKNTPPVAQTGAAQHVIVNTLTKLDGSPSTDADNDALTYKWVMTSSPAGSTATLSSDTSAQPTFTPDLTGVYSFSLVVNDGKATSTTANTTVTVTVGNAAPVANAGPLQNVIVGNTVTLDGRDSADANRDPLSFAWTLLSRPADSVATLTSSNTPKPTFVADKPGTYVAGLVVNDGFLDSAIHAVTITATIANAAPVAVAGPDQNVIAGTLITLDGSGSTDANRDILTFKWTLVSKPASSTATLSSLTSAKPTFTADAAGVYVASLTVHDGQLESAVSVVSINATVANAAPVAVAGTNQNVVAGTVVTLDGSRSSDANHDALTYKWALINKPANSTATLTTDTAIAPTFTADASGTYVISLIVNDGKLDSAMVAVTVTATAVNAAPVANAGTAQTVATASVVTLNGSGSTDANRDALTYKWALTSKPASSTAALSSATAVNPTFTADLAGVYVASLIVNDGQVDSTVATVPITAGP